jgi:ubiquinone/menaquinone biosynthesis C-methylase UbiE
MCERWHLFGSVWCSLRMVMSRVLDHAFGHPQGALGRLGGKLMARGNAGQEARAVEQAALQPGEQVLVVGPGPGVGLKLAAGAVAPSGHVIGVEPSAVMRKMAANRAATEIEQGLVEIRAGTAEATGCANASVDAAMSVNNIMLWNLPLGLAELARVLRPRARLVVSVHRHVLHVAPEKLRDQMAKAGFTDVALSLRKRRFSSPAVELLAHRTDG